MSHIIRFFRNEDGAVTVDWVILTASVVFLAIGVIDGVFRDSMLDVVDATAALVEGAMQGQ